MSLLSVEALSVRYAGLAAVEELSFTIDSGESVGLVGESGSGKTQTAMATLGLLPANAMTTGSIRLHGTELLGASEAALNALRARKMAIVFQDPMQALNPYVCIGAQIRRVLEEHRLASGARAREHVIAMLERVGLPDAERQYRAYPHQLSGGMRQRATSPSKRKYSSYSQRFARIRRCYSLHMIWALLRGAVSARW
jgi:ABC-type glutathione transport system ATPase component